jgi:hypothetical protein
MSRASGMSGSISGGMTGSMSSPMGGGDAADAKFELATAAAGAERANKPKTLIVIAGALLAVAVIATGMALSSRLAAQRKLDTERGRATEMVTLAAKLKQLNEASAGGKRTGRITLLPTTLNQAARAAGIKTDPVMRNMPDSRNGDVVRKKMEYDVRDESLEAILRWIDSATKQVQGLEVFSFNVKPESQVWHAKVTFSWWENAR